MCLSVSKHASSMHRSMVPASQVRASFMGGKSSSQLVWKLKGELTFVTNGNEEGNVEVFDRFSNRKYYLVTNFLLG